MGIVSGIVVFLMVWWTAIFCVLPFGLKRDQNGMPLGSPNLKRKFLYTTLLSMVIWGGIEGLMKANVISFHDLASAMTREEQEDEKR